MEGNFKHHVPLSSVTPSTLPGSTAATKEFSRATEEFIVQNTYQSVQGVYPSVNADTPYVFYDTEAEGPSESNYLYGTKTILPTSIASNAPGLDKPSDSFFNQVARQMTQANGSIVFSYKFPLFSDINLSTVLQKIGIDPTKLTASEFDMIRVRPRYYIAQILNDPDRAMHLKLDPESASSPRGNMEQLYPSKPDATKQRNPEDEALSGGYKVHDLFKIEEPTEAVGVLNALNNSSEFNADMLRRGAVAIMSLQLSSHLIPHMNKYFIEQMIHFYPSVAPMLFNAFNFSYTQNQYAYNEFVGDLRSGSYNYQKYLQELQDLLPQDKTTTPSVNGVIAPVPQVVKDMVSNRKKQDIARLTGHLDAPGAPPANPVPPATTESTQGEQKTPQSTEPPPIIPNRDGFEPRLNDRDALEPIVENVRQTNVTISPEASESHGKIVAGMMREEFAKGMRDFAHTLRAANKSHSSEISEALVESSGTTDARLKEILVGLTHISKQLNPLMGWGGEVTEMKALFSEMNNNIKELRSSSQTSPTGLQMSDADVSNVVQEEDKDPSGRQGRRRGRKRYRVARTSRKEILSSNRFMQEMWKSKNLQRDSDNKSFRDILSSINALTTTAKEVEKNIARSIDVLEHISETSSNNRSMVPSAVKDALSPINTLLVDHFDQQTKILNLFELAKEEITKGNNAHTLAVNNNTETHGEMMRMIKQFISSDHHKESVNRALRMESFLNNKFDSIFEKLSKAYSEESTRGNQLTVEHISGAVGKLESIRSELVDLKNSSIGEIRSLGKTVADGVSMIKHVNDQVESSVGRIQSSISIEAAANRVMDAASTLFSCYLSILRETGADVTQGAKDLLNDAQNANGTIPRDAFAILQEVSTIELGIQSCLNVTTNSTSTADVPRLLTPVRAIFIALTRIRLIMHTVQNPQDIPLAKVDSTSSQVQRISVLISEKYRLNSPLPVESVQELTPQHPPGATVEEVTDAVESKYKEVIGSVGLVQNKIMGLLEQYFNSTTNQIKDLQKENQQSANDIQSDLGNLSTALTHARTSLNTSITEGNSAVTKAVAAYQGGLQDAIKDNPAIINLGQTLTSVSDHIQAVVEQMRNVADTAESLSGQTYVPPDTPPASNEQVDALMEALSRVEKNMQEFNFSALNSAVQEIRKNVSDLLSEDATRTASAIENVTKSLTTLITATNTTLESGFLKSQQLANENALAVHGELKNAVEMLENASPHVTRMPDYKRHRGTNQNINRRIAIEDASDSDASHLSYVTWKPPAPIIHMDEDEGSETPGETPGENPPPPQPPADQDSGVPVAPPAPNSEEAASDAASRPRMALTVSGWGNALEGNEGMQVTPLTQAEARKVGILKEFQDPASTGLLAPTETTRGDNEEDEERPAKPQTVSNEPPKEYSAAQLREMKRLGLEPGDWERMMQMNPKSRSGREQNYVEKGQKGEARAKKANKSRQKLNREAASASDAAVMAHYMTEVEQHNTDPEIDIPSVLGAVKGVVDTEEQAMDSLLRAEDSGEMKDDVFTPGNPDANPALPSPDSGSVQNPPIDRNEWEDPAKPPPTQPIMSDYDTPRDAPFPLISHSGGPRAQASGGAIGAHHPDIHRARMGTLLERHPQLCVTDLTVPVRNNLYQNDRSNVLDSVTPHSSPMGLAHLVAKNVLYSQPDLNHVGILQPPVGTNFRPQPGSKLFSAIQHNDKLLRTSALTGQMGGAVDHHEDLKDMLQKYQTDDEDREDGRLFFGIPLSSTKGSMSKGEITQQLLHYIANNQGGLSLDGKLVPIPWNDSNVRLREAMEEQRRDAQKQEAVSKLMQDSPRLKSMLMDAHENKMTIALASAATHPPTNTTAVLPAGPKESYINASFSKSYNDFITTQMDVKNIAREENTICLAIETLRRYRVYHHQYVAPTKSLIGMYTDALQEYQGWVHDAVQVENEETEWSNILNSSVNEALSGELAANYQLPEVAECAAERRKYFATSMQNRQRKLADYQQKIYQLQNNLGAEWESTSLEANLRNILHYSKEGVFVYDPQDAFLKQTRVDNLSTWQMLKPDEHVNLGVVSKYHPQSETRKRARNLMGFVSSRRMPGGRYSHPILRGPILRKMHEEAKEYGFDSTHSYVQEGVRNQYHALMDEAVQATEVDRGKLYASQPPQPVYPTISKVLTPPENNDERVSYETGPFEWLTQLSNELYFEAQERPVQTGTILPVINALNPPTGNVSIPQVERPPVLEKEKVEKVLEQVQEGSPLVTEALPPNLPPIPVPDPPAPPVVTPMTYPVVLSTDQQAFVNQFPRNIHRFVKDQVLNSDRKDQIVPFYQENGQKDFMKERIRYLSDTQNSKHRSKLRFWTHKSTPSVRYGVKFIGDLLTQKPVSDTHDDVLESMQHRLN